MKPYAGQLSQSPERVFNYQLSRARRIVENAFGIMASVFRVFRKPMQLKVDNVEKITKACVYLHNYLRKSKTSRSLYTPSEIFDNEDLENGTIIPVTWRSITQNDAGLICLDRVPRRPPTDAKLIREEFKEYFMTAQGKVEWQDIYHSLFTEVSLFKSLCRRNLFQLQFTFQMFNNIASNFGIQTTFVDCSRTENITGAIRDNTKLLWLENPTYPTLRVFDICNLVTYAKQRRLYLGIDNTYLTPYLQRPLEFHADIVLQSCTKYMNGHSDMVQGAVCTNNKALMKAMQKVQRLYGLVPSPFDCYEVLRGLKTLALRMDEHSKNALKTHHNNEIFKKQSSGHSGMISFYVKGGKEEAKRFIGSLNLFTVTDVFGGNESTAQIPSLMSHEGLPKATREKLKITDNLINISVGLEDVCDILADLEQALDKVKLKEEDKKC
nr:unnamed protein product [Callosobruchus analis]